jgi:hypothetical protein
MGALVALAGFLGGGLLTLRALVAPIRIVSPRFSLSQAPGGTPVMVVRCRVKNRTKGKRTMARLAIFIRPSRGFRLRHPRWKSTGGFPVVMPAKSTVQQGMPSIEAGDAADVALLLRRKEASRLDQGHPMLLAGFADGRPTVKRIKRSVGLLEYPA